MKKVLVLVGVLVMLSILAAGCNKPTAEEATTAFCDSLAKFEDTVTNLSAITSTSTVEELGDATAEVGKAWNQVVESAQDLKDVRLSDIDESWKDLQKTINNIDSDDTLAAARANIDAGLTNVRTAVDQIGTTSCLGSSGEETATKEPTAEEPAAEEPTADTTVEAPAEVAAEPPAEAEVIPPGFAGTYSTTLPLAGVTELDLVLVLNQDFTTYLVIRAVGETTETIVSGVWQENPDDTATVTLSDLISGEKLASPEILTFQLAGDQLVAVGFDTTVYGADGFTMERQAVAVSGGADAAPIDAGTGVTETVPVSATAPLTTTAPLASTGQTTATTPGQPAVPLIPAAPAQATGNSLMGVSWQLQQINQASGISFTPDDPSRYVVRFGEDDALGVIADCNNLTGTYQADEDGSLSIQLPATVTYCAAGSLSNQFLSYLAVANAYSLNGDQMAIQFSNGHGVMTFTAAP